MASENVLSIHHLLQNRKNMIRSEVSLNIVQQVKKCDTGRRDPVKVFLTGECKEEQDPNLTQFVQTNEVAPLCVCVFV